MIWIGYTTLYRDGGPKFERAAATLENDKRAKHPDREVRRERIESKRDFVAAMERIRGEGETLDELHFIGHSGMYGPMFRTTAMPEQFSPHEWRTLPLPFAKRASAYFHACRTARWFAPFFARTYGVTAYGYHWYTTISARPDRFAWEGVRGVKDRVRIAAKSTRVANDAPLYVIACPGKKSHGLAGSVMKYGGLLRAETMKRFEAREPEGDTGYDGVAELYAEAFRDIGVRVDEWRWLAAHLPSYSAADDGRAADGARHDESPGTTQRNGPRVLDIGCGNGALLAKLAPRIANGVGVDRSPRMIELSRRRATAERREHLSFEMVDGPRLPFADASFDVVVSLLSFRYLDWDPIMNEIRRVLAPGGRLLLIDMVTVPLRPTELYRFARSKTRQLIQSTRQPAFRRALRRVVSDPRWRVMLQHNPIRSDHEMRWYLESRFPGRKIELLTVGFNTRVLAFDSGPLDPGWVPPQSYP